MKNSKRTLPMNVRPVKADKKYATRVESKLYTKLTDLLMEWQDHRKITVEDIWTKAYENFKGDFDDVEFKGSKAANAWRSKAFYPLTEQKVTAAQAQLQDVLFKGGRFPYDVKTSPIPDDPAMQVVIERAANGAVAPGVDLAKKSMDREELDQRIKNMKKRLDDQFAECDAASVGLISIFDGALYGTAFLESPRVVRKRRYRWTKTAKGYSKKEVFEDVPTVVNLDPWDCWADPECGGMVANGLGFFHRERMSVPGLYDLFALVFPDGIEMSNSAESEEYEYEYNRKEFEDLLANVSEESGSEPDESYGPNAAIESGHANRLYEVFTFAGSVQNKCLKDYMKVTGPDNHFSEVIVVFCDGFIIKCVKNPFPGERRPFHMVPWTKLPGQAYGRGVSEKIFDPQKNVNRLMRMYIDNKRLSGNLMTAIDKSKLKRNADMTLYPGKNWEFEGAFQDADVRKLVMPVFFPDVTAGVLEAIGTMVAWADQSSGIPRILEGQPGQDASTAYAENQRISAASKQLGLVLKNYDMHAWVPIVESFYDWNMEFLKDTAIKGDFSIIATGFATFENRHLRKLDLERLLLMSQQMPALQMKVKPDPVIEDWAIAGNIDPERYLLTPEEVAQKMKTAQEEQMNNFAAQMQMEQQKQAMEHGFEMQKEKLTQELSGQVRMALAEIAAQTKAASEETKRLIKLADIESKEKLNAKGNGSGRGQPPNRR